MPWVSSITYIMSDIDKSPLLLLGLIAYVIAKGKSMIEWTKEMNEMLISLIEEEDMTYTQAAREMTAVFGLNFTKGSVIGKGRKLGIPPRPTRTEETVTEDPPVVPDIPPPKEGDPVTIYQLREGMCKWPLGGPFDRPPFMFCGVAVNQLGGSWCPDHCKIVYGGRQ
jgi:hypothetical protein